MVYNAVLRPNKKHAERFGISTEHPRFFWGLGMKYWLPYPKICLGSAKQISLIYTEVPYQGGRPFETTASSPDLGILGDFKSNYSTTHLIKKIPQKMYIVAISRGESTSTASLK